jgi:hypothetical protein
MSDEMEESQMKVFFSIVVCLMICGQAQGTEAAKDGDMHKESPGATMASIVMGGACCGVLEEVTNCRFTWCMSILGASGYIAGGYLGYLWSRSHQPEREQKKNVAQDQEKTT